MSGERAWRLGISCWMGLVRLVTSPLIVVDDPEPASELLHHILHKRLSIEPSEHPIMLTEPAWNTTTAREKLAEMVFEGEKVPAMYLGSAGVLSA
jgi:actin-related protein